MSSEERKKILQMVEQGKISAEQAASLMRALAEDAEPSELETVETEPAPGFAGPETSSSELEDVKRRAQRFAMIPLWVGILIAVLSSWGIYSIQHNAGMNF